MDQGRRRGEQFWSEVFNIYGIYILPTGKQRVAGKRVITGGRRVNAKNRHHAMYSMYCMYLCGDKEQDDTV